MAKLKADPRLETVVVGEMRVMKDDWPDEYQIDKAGARVWAFPPAHSDEDTVAEAYRSGGDYRCRLVRSGCPINLDGVLGDEQAVRLLRARFASKTSCERCGRRLWATQEYCTPCDDGDGWVEREEAMESPVGIFEDDSKVKGRGNQHKGKGGKVLWSDARRWENGERTIQVLCTPCHRAKTAAELAAERDAKFLARCDEARALGIPESSVASWMPPRPKGK